jgi:hypothetical protein
LRQRTGGEDMRFARERRFGVPVCVCHRRTLATSNCHCTHKIRASSTRCNALTTVSPTHVKQQQMMGCQGTCACAAALSAHKYPFHPQRDVADGIPDAQRGKSTRYLSWINRPSGISGPTCISS